MERQNTLEVCPLCSEHVGIYAIGPCDHPVCYKCSTRMRVLHEQMYCAICRSDLNKVIFVKNLDKYDMINTQRFQVNRKVKVSFEDEEVENAYYALLAHQCNQCSARKPLRSFSDLKDHMRREHNKHYCDLCLQHLKLFSSERKCYERSKLAEHRRQGDPDDRSHKGHPLCKFCDQRYLDNDELVKHLRKDHYFCHFCEADGVTNEFYSEYPLLKIHFGEEHYLCEEGECANAEFINAFGDDIDFKGHRASMHSKGLRKQAAKQARTIDIEVNLAPRSGTGSRGGPRERKDRDRNRGVVGREDYEDIQKEGGRRNEAPGRGRPDRGRQEAQRKREEIETAQAISASLACKSGINVVDRSLLDPVLGTAGSDEEVKREKYQRRSEDFPNLQGELISAKPETEPSEDKLKVKPSMAKTFARSSNFSIQEDSMGTDDFPSLGNKKTGNKPLVSNSARSAWNFQPNKSDFPALGGSSTSAQKVAKPAESSWTSAKPKQPQQKQKMTKRTDLSSMQDFPSLTKIGNGLLSNQIPGLAPFATERKSSTKKKGKTFQVVKQNASGPQSKVQNDENKSVSEANLNLLDTKKINKDKSHALIATRSAGSPVGNSSPKNDRSPVNQRMEDFPALEAPRSNAKTTWGPKETKPESQKPSKEDSSLVVLKSKSKSKKKKGKVENVENGGRTSSASDHEGKVKIIDSKQPEENSKNMASLENVSEANPVTLVKTGPAKKQGSIHTALTDQSSSINIPLILDDFPVLGADKSRAPPPGFSITAKPKGPPPGFSSRQRLPKSDVGQPPPGFSKTPAASLATIANTYDKPAPPPDLMPKKTKNEAFIKPTNFADRNQNLIRDIQELTSDDPDAFQQFKLLSSQYRQGSIEANEYYQQCGEVIGKEKFIGIFSELLVLLPNIIKQQELLKVHNYASSKSGYKNDKDIVKISGRSKNRGWNKVDNSIAACPSCLQVVSQRDLVSHGMEHNLDSDFPILGK